MMTNGIASLKKWLLSNVQKSQYISKLKLTPNKHPSSTQHVKISAPTVTTELVDPGITPAAPKYPKQ
eukprot:348894-Amphidinium_carterae.1